jgi:hypothetical protein
MGTIIDQVEGGEQEGEAPVRCPICGVGNLRMDYCRHVRWTFDQGGPIEFARFAMTTSHYQHPRGLTVRNIPKLWWDEHGDWVVERVLHRFGAAEGYVFGEPAELDLLTMDIWKAFEPQPERAPICRG